MYDACPDCDGQINDFGFCEDCGLDYEDFLKETENEWDELHQAGDGSSGTNDQDDDGWLDIYRENQRP